MKELSEYRTQLINRLATAARAFREACLAVKDPFATVESGGWNVHQIAVHVRDVNQLAYGLRVRLTAAEDNPEFQSFDGDAYARDHYSADEPLEALLAGFVQNVEDLTDMLRNLPALAWSRGSRHEILGNGVTLQTWVERGLAHIEEHLETVGKNSVI